MAKLDDIRRAVEQRQQAPSPPDPASSPRERPPGSRPYVAQMGDVIKDGLLGENQRLKAEREGGMVLLRLDPKQIGRTEFANRHDLSLSSDDPDFRQLKASIKQHGQDTPVRVRPAGAVGALPYELVEGHRRHAACLELDAEQEGGFPILARLDAAAADTRDLVLKMYRENAERADLSPYEYGRMFQSWLSGKVFASQSELARPSPSSSPPRSRLPRLLEPSSSTAPPSRSPKTPPKTAPSPAPASKFLTKPS